MSAVVEEQLKKARDILSESIPLSEYIEDNKLGYTRGISGKICCPVHDESTPSFFFDGNKKRFNCFGCGVRGTIVELHYRIHQKDNDRYTIIRSIRELANEYGIEIPDLYERSVEIKESRKPSQRKRGVSGRGMDWVYREKLLSLEGRVLSMSKRNRAVIAGLMDDVWLGKKTGKTVYREVIGLIKEEQDKKRSEG